jgi:hypothetical protein
MNKITGSCFEAGTFLTAEHLPGKRLRRITDVAFYVHTGNNNSTFVAAIRKTVYCLKADSNEI